MPGRGLGTREALLTPSDPQVPTLTELGLPSAQPRQDASLLQGSVSLIGAVGAQRGTTSSLGSQGLSGERVFNQEALKDDQEFKQAK